MDITIDQQVALDEARVPHASRLKIRKTNFHLRSDITSKESTLQLVYDVLRLTPFYKAFLVTADVPEIHMQEFWATATVHHHSIRFKMDNKKHIVNFEYFKKMLHICPRLPGQTFDELLFEEEILAFLRFLRHNGEIRKLTDVNINKLHQPWRSFAAVIHKCLSGKSTGYDSLWLSQAQVLWGMYHKKNVDFAYLLWEDFIYQVEHKDAKKSNEMYYPRFKKLSIHEEEAKDEESFDPIVQTPKNSNNEGNDDASLGLNVASEEGQDAEDDDDELYRDVNINLEGQDSSSVSSQFVTSMLNPSPDAGIDSLFEITPWVDVQASTIVAPLTLTAPTLPPTTIPTISQTLEANFSEFVQTNQFSGAVSSILGIAERYIYQRMNEAVKVAVQIQSDRLRDEAQAENEEFLKNLDENIQKIIKEQVKEQVKVQVSKILPKVEKTVNEQLEAEVLTRSSNSSKTSYAVAADLS
nr:hypothetical protein [Tanacetum cinerariifolium]